MKAHTTKEEQEAATARLLKERAVREEDLGALRVPGAGRYPVHARVPSQLAASACCGGAQKQKRMAATTEHPQHARAAALRALLLAQQQPTRLASVARYSLSARLSAVSIVLNVSASDANASLSRSSILQKPRLDFRASRCTWRSAWKADWNST